MGINLIPHALPHALCMYTQFQSQASCRLEKLQNYKKTALLITNFVCESQKNILLSTVE